MKNRREFLLCLVGAAAGLAAGRLVLNSVPHIHGDGIHDDAPGLDAFFNGRPYTVEPGAMTTGYGNQVKFEKTYLIEEPEQGYAITIPGGYPRRVYIGTIVIRRRVKI